MDTRLIPLLTLTLFLWVHYASADAPSHEIKKPQRLDTLATLQEVKKNLTEEIIIKSSELKDSLTESDKTLVSYELDKLSNDLTDIDENFEQISTGLSSELDNNKPTQKFNLKNDIGALIQPIIKEMKHATSGIRQKTQLRDELGFYEEKFFHAGVAVENIRKLIKKAEGKKVHNKKLTRALNKLLEKWSRRLKQAKSNHRSVELQLQTMEAESEKESFLTSSEIYLKSFFEKRGLYLSLGLLAIMLVLLLSRLFYRLVLSRLVGLRSTNRSFRQRLVELVYRVLTVVFSIAAPMAVFYIAQDWLLFSLGILLLFGLAWTLKYTIPKLWEQMILMLNIGPVREGERIAVDGLPWRVKQLNVYTLLDNPTAELKMRVPIEKMVGKISRPIAKGEPWFPCKRSDWVILSDGVRGKVVGLSHEMIELVERGGARVNYQMADFLSLSPKNISQSFRIKETFGISYDLQKESTGEILETLEHYIHEQLIKEGYGDDLMNLRVEFAYANASSLDLAIIADFKGAQAPVYNRIRRAIQRWCVDACSQYHWEIPFTQMVIHQKED